MDDSRTPDAGPVSEAVTAVVLSGGGARGAYQVGVLRWIARQYPELRLPILTGVSAGAINAAFLAGRPEPLSEALDLLGDMWGELSTGEILRADVLSLLGNAFKVVMNLGSGGAKLAPQVRR